MYAQREFQQKLSTLLKACDVTWPEKCKQTLADSLISSVEFVLSTGEGGCFVIFRIFKSILFFVN